VVVEGRHIGLTVGVGRQTWPGQDVVGIEVVVMNLELEVDLPAPGARIYS
jgi:hypothetical protein